MFKFLMGIVTAVLIVAAILILTPPQGDLEPAATAPGTPATGDNTSGTANGTSEREDDTSLTPAPSELPDGSKPFGAADDDSASDGAATTASDADATGATSGTEATDTNTDATTGPEEDTGIRLEGGDVPGRSDAANDRETRADSSALASVPMEELVIDELDMRMYVPEGWLRLDKNGMRTMLLNYRGETDAAAVENRVAPIIFWTLPGAPEQGAQAELIVEVLEDTSQGVLEVLDKKLGDKRQRLDDVEVLEAPRQATLGGFEGGMMVTRERIPSAAGDIVLDTQIWVLETTGRYVVLTAPMPESDSDGRAVVEAIIGSVGRLQNG